MEKLGVKMVVVRAGQFKGMMQPWRLPTQEEEQKLEAWKDEVYEWFVESVGSARGMPREDVRELATGEMFTGAMAKEKGLVDELGDLQTAIGMAAEMAGIPKRVTYVRPPRPLAQRLLSPLGTTIAERLIAELESRLGVRLELRR